MNNENENSGDLSFTGERYLPEIAGQIAFEHLHRYYLAREYAAGLRVLDVACGEGYGSSIVAPVANSVVGVDISRESVEHAQKKYSRDNLSFIEASAADLPFSENEFDLVMSFETIEHHALHEEMMDEIKRVLKPKGMLIISSPNKQHYSIDENYSNPFHVKELYKEEFLALVRRRFSRCVLLGQRVVHGSLIALEEATDGGFQSFSNGFGPKEGGVAVDSGLRAPLYDIIIASDDEFPNPDSSIFEMSIHGMDPARFYGAHLPDRVSTADQRILALEAELGTGPAKMDAILGCVQEISNKQEREAGERHALLEQLSSACLQLEKVQAEYADARQEIEIGHGELEQMRKTTAENHSLLERISLDLDSALSEKQRLLLELDDALSERNRMSEELGGLKSDLHNVSRELDEARKDLASIRNSRSWRMTAWLRALSRMTKGERQE